MRRNISLQRNCDYISVAAIQRRLHGRGYQARRSTCLCKVMGKAVADDLIQRYHRKMIALLSSYIAGGLAYMIKRCALVQYPCLVLVPAICARCPFLGFCPSCLMSHRHSVDMVTDQKSAGGVGGGVYLPVKLSSNTVAPQHMKRPPTRPLPSTG